MLVPSCLTVVSNAPNSAIDVVFIHGLPDGGEKSWSKHNPDGTWPIVLLERLTSAVPNARIITFRNDYICGFRQRSAEKDSYAGRQMYAELQETRRHESKERPLILVSHSWGGLITDEGLLRALADAMAYGVSIFGLIFIEESDTANLLKHYCAPKQLAVTPFQTSYFKSSRHNGVEGYSESFKILDGINEGLISDLEVVSIYGYVSLMDLLDEALSHTRGPVAQMDIRHCGDNVDMALDSISSRVFNVVRRTIRALSSQINDEDTTADTTAVLACGNGSCYDGIIDCLSQHPRANIQNPYNPLSCIKRRETGNWLVQLPEFNSWIQNDNNSIFWLSGSMGSGKSVLTSYVVEDLKQRLNRGTGCMIASYFFDARYKVSASAATVLKEMIQEVLQRQHHAPARERLQSILVNLNAGDTKISPSQLRAYFTAIRHTLAIGESMFLVLDGLDDLDESETNLIKELIYLARHQNDSHQIKCFISSRSRWTRDEAIEGSVRINIDNEARARECLAYFVQNEVENLLDTSYYGDILYKKLSTNPEGAFSRAVLALRTLGQVDEFNEGQIQALIESLPSTLTGMYQLMLEKISDKDRTRARKLFAFVTYAARPLRVSELLTLLDLDMRDLLPWGQKKSPYSSEKSHSIEEDIPRLSGGLLTACQDGTVNFVHLSARDYVKSQCSGPLLGHFGMSEHHAHELLTRICFHYLHPIQLKRFMEFSKDCQFPTGNQSFTAYAVQYWSFHYGNAEAQSDSLPVLLHNLILENLNSTRCESCGAKGISPGRNMQDSTNAALGIGTQVGSEKLVRMLLEMGADPNITVDSDGQTALHIAARAGNLDVVELLLRRGAYINPVTVRTERTPLYYASAGGYTEVMRALLDAGKVFSCGLNAFNDPFKCVPLCTAWNVHGLLDYKNGALPLNNLRLLSARKLCSQMLAHTDELSRRLWTAKESLDASFGDITSKLRKHLGTDTRRGQFQNEANLAVLQEAAREALIQRLLDSGSDGVWQYSEGWGVEDFSAVEAVESEFQLTMQVLLDVHATHDTNAAHNWGTALEVAVERGQEASIRFLLEHEAVLPPNVTIRIGQASKDRPTLQLRGQNVSEHSRGPGIVPPELVTTLSGSTATEQDNRFKGNCLEWLASKNSKFW